jgi:hypothetical protein
MSGYVGWDPAAQAGVHPVANPATRSSIVVADEEIRFMGVVERNRILSQMMMAIAKGAKTHRSACCLFPSGLHPTGTKQRSARAGY